MLLNPKRTPQRMVALAPMETRSETHVAIHSDGPLACLTLGDRSLVNTTFGPTNTSSPMFTPCQISELFLTVTRLPIVAPPSMNTWSPILQFSPTTAPSNMWANAQILVPAPTSALSTRAV